MPSNAASARMRCRCSRSASFRTDASWPSAWPTMSPNNSSTSSTSCGGRGVPGEKRTTTAPTPPWSCPAGTKSRGPPPSAGVGSHQPSDGSCAGSDGTGAPGVVDSAGQRARARPPGSSTAIDAAPRAGPISASPASRRAPTPPGGAVNSPRAARATEATTLVPPRPISSLPRPAAIDGASRHHQAAPLRSPPPYTPIAQARQAQGGRSMRLADFRREPAWPQSIDRSQDGGGRSMRIADFRPPGGGRGHGDPQPRGS